MRIFKVSLLALLIACLTSLSYSATPDRITGALNNGQTVALRGYVHRQAVPKNDRGPVDPALRFGSIMMATRPTPVQKQAMTQLLADQQNPKSKNFHKWLTPERFADRFGLSQNDVKKITDWLKSEGFRVTYVARARNWITFSGTAAQVQNAFGTEIHRYSVNGKTHVANATSPKIPAALADIVTGISGLDDFHLKPRTRVRPNYFSSTLNVQLIAPGDIATIYDIGAMGVDGSGEKLAVIGQTDVYQAELNDFRNAFGLAPMTCTTSGTDVITSCDDPVFQYVVPQGVTDLGAPDIEGDLTEADLDIEWAGAIARNAQIIYVNAPATFDNNGNIVSGGSWLAWKYAVDQNLAPVISLSYGNCEWNFPYNVATDNGDESELQLASMEGITFVNSSGDSGAAGCDGVQTGVGANLAQGGYGAAWPATSPEVTGVGGTAVIYPDGFTSTYFAATNTNGSSAQAVYPFPELAWNDDEEFVPFCGLNTCNNIDGTDSSTVQGSIGIFSSGGGPSNCAFQTAGLQACSKGFDQPSYQSGITIGPTPAVRLTPDVALLASANFPGFIICTDVSELQGDGASGSTCAGGIESALGLNTPPVIGGTSAAAPVFAGIVTLLNQYLAGPASPGLGNINPTLYQLAATTTGSFNLVNTGSNLVFCTPGTPNFQPPAVKCPGTGVLGFDSADFDAATGYNLVTGLGSVDANNLAVSWAAGRNPTSITITPSATSVSQGTSVTFTATLDSTTALGNVYFYNTNGATTTLGSAPLVSGQNGVVTFATTALPVGSDSISAVYNGDGANASSRSATPAAVTVTGAPSFTLAPDAGTYTVTQGSSATVQITLTPANGFNQAVTYSCTDPASESTCTGPSGATTTSPVSFTVTTTAATSSLLQPMNRGSRVFYAALLPGLMGIVCVAGSRKRSLAGMRMLGLIMVLGASTMWLGSCGSSSNSSHGNPGTPKQTYTLTVSATTGGATPISGQTTFHLTVQ